MKTAQAIITKSPCAYMPLNEPCNVTINDKGYICSAHRLSDGSGTHLSYKWQAAETEYQLI